MKKTIATLALLMAAGCGGSGNSNDNKDLAASCTGGPTAGPADTHCDGDGGGIFIGDVNPTMCTTSSGDDGAPDYGATMYGTMGRDDDCKYVVSYTVDPICENDGVTYVVTATYAKDGTPVTGAATVIEAYLNGDHPAPNAGTTTKESSPGVYTIGPVKFDAPGMWTVRFHFFETCADVDGSPHGHAAFYMTVP